MATRTGGKLSFHSFSLFRKHLDPTEFHSCNAGIVNGQSSKRLTNAAMSFRVPAIPYHDVICPYIIFIYLFQWCYMFLYLWCYMSLYLWCYMALFLTCFILCSTFLLVSFSICFFANDQMTYLASLEFLSWFSLHGVTHQPVMVINTSHFIPVCLWNICWLSTYCLNFHVPNIKSIKYLLTFQNFQIVVKIRHSVGSYWSKMNRKRWVKFQL